MHWTNENCFSKFQRFDYFFRMLGLQNPLFKQTKLPMRCCVNTAKNKTVSILATVNTIHATPLTFWLGFLVPREAAAPPRS